MIRNHNIDFNEIPNQFNDMKIDINNANEFIIDDSNKKIISA